MFGGMPDLGAMGDAMGMGGGGSRKSSKASSKGSKKAAKKAAEEAAAAQAGAAAGDAALAGLLTAKKEEEEDNQSFFGGLMKSANDTMAKATQAHAEATTIDKTVIPKNDRLWAWTVTMDDVLKTAGDADVTKWAPPTNVSGMLYACIYGALLIHKQPAIDKFTLRSLHQQVIAVGKQQKAVKNDDEGDKKKKSKGPVGAPPKLDVTFGYKLLDGLGRAVNNRLTMIRHFDLEASYVGGNLMEEGWERVDDGKGSFYFSNKETKKTSWEPPTGGMFSSSEFKNPYAECKEYGMAKDGEGKIYYLNKANNETSWDPLFPLDIAITEIYRAMTACYKKSNSGFTEYFAIISNAPSKDLKEFKKEDARCVLWSLKVQGECIDSVIYDSKAQDGGKANIHKRESGFIGFRTRKEAEEYLHWIFMWDKAIANKTIAKDPIARGSWKVWVFCVGHKKQLVDDIVMRADHVDPPNDWVPKKAMFGDSIVGWVNKFTKEQVEEKPHFSRVSEVSQAWEEKYSAKGARFWTNKITGKTSYREPDGPSVNSNLWILKVEEDGKKSWYNPYSKKKVFKNPYEDRGDDPALRPYDTHTLTHRKDPNKDIWEEDSDDDIIFFRTPDGNIVTKNKKGKQLDD